ncbi:hypothetical protein ACU5AX_01510 [Sphingomonas sp. XXL09]|uniref:hypothetical protein n=1 Tax=Sphingomonas sp. XXL09 TaxID=3457787 RepID=UPI00406BBEE3
MKIASAVPALSLCLVACVQQSERKWTTHAASPSPYSATLIETDYNNGESNALRVRVDAAPHGDNGWFFVEDLSTGLITSPQPDMRWISPNDLLVTVHTAEIEGQTRRRFAGQGRPSGSLTIRYIADQKPQ